MVGKIVKYMIVIQYPKTEIKGIEEIIEASINFKDYNEYVITGENNQEIKEKISKLEKGIKGLQK